MNNKIKLIIFAIVTIIALSSIIILSKWDYVEINDLSSPKTIQISSKSKNIHYLILHVTGYSKNGGLLKSHDESKETIIPKGKINIKIGNDCYSQKSIIEYIPNGSDEGRLKIRYKFKKT